MARQSRNDFSGRTVTCGPTKAILIFGLALLIAWERRTGYQYDSISRVAGQRDPAPPSKFSNEGGFRNRVFRGIWVFNYFNIRRSGCGFRTVLQEVPTPPVKLLDSM